MENNLPAGNLWSILSVDSDLTVTAVSNFKPSLYFGIEIIAGSSLTEWRNQCAQENIEQISLVISKIEQALLEKRNVFLEYKSLDFQSHLNTVALHIEYIDSSTVRLYATEIDVVDIQQIHHKRNLIPSEQVAQGILREVYKNLPVGIEIYDRDGFLIDINPLALNALHIQDREDVIGFNFYDNPNLSDEIKNSLRQGEEIQYTFHIDYTKAETTFFDPSIKGKKHFDVSVSVIRDLSGAIDKYLFIIQDITEQVLLNRKYKRLYNQSRTILDSLPIGVELYSKEGTQLFMNKAAYRMFGMQKEDVLSGQSTIFHDPDIPEEVKEALRNEQTIQIQYPYHYKSIVEEGGSSSIREETIQVDCSGQPVLNSSGEMEGYVFIFSDITEAIRTREELIQSKKKIELAMQAGDIVVWEFDNRTELTFSENEPLSNFDNTKPLMMDDYHSIFHPDDLDIATSNLELMREGTNQPFCFDVRVMLPDDPDWQYCTVIGTPYLVESNNKVTKYVGIRRNNTAIQRRKMLQEKILNQIPLPILIKDPDNEFRYLFCNEKAKHVLGAQDGQYVYDVMDPDVATRIDESDKEVIKTGEPYFGKERIKLKDGKIHDTIVQKCVLHDGGKRLLLSVRWDISEQVELERQSKVLSISMDALNAYTWVYDPEEGEFIFGDGSERSKENLNRFNSIEKFATVVHPDDKEIFVRSLYDVLSKEHAEFRFEYRVDFEGDGNYEWWEGRGVVETTVRNDRPYRYMFGMDINIDSHKNTELTLMKNKEELAELIRKNELVLNNTNSGLAYITPDYIVQWENISKCTTSLSFEAYKKGELCYVTAHRRDTPCTNCVLDRVIRSKQMERIQFSLENKRTVEVFATPVFDDQREIQGVVIRVDDITERQQMIRELTRAKALAEQSDKLKSAFLANMSHEIRTPLNAIVGFSELLLHTDEKEEREQFMDIINSNNELLLKLINDVLDLSKIEAGTVELNYEEFDLSECVSQYVSSLKFRITNPDVSFIFTNPYDRCVVTLDKSRLTQIMANYVTNAIKFTAKGFIEVGYELVKDGVCLYVKDSGVGIPEDKKHKLFHRFEKLDDFAQGTGLGLSICKAIAESMGGKVGFESVEGVGSKFWVFLPCVIAVIEQKADKNGHNNFISSVNGALTECAVPDAAVERDKTILVVEDIQSNYLLISALLRNQFNLVRAINGLEAIEVVNTHPIDLVLMDMKMPIMDGITATERIRKQMPDLPIVALTAHAFESDRVAALEAGCNDYLVKPINKERLISVIEHFIA